MIPEETNCNVNVKIVNGGTFVRKWKKAMATLLPINTDRTNCMMMRVKNHQVEIEQ